MDYKRSAVYIHTDNKLINFNSKAIYSALVTIIILAVSYFAFENYSMLKAKGFQLYSSVIQNQSGSGLQCNTSKEDINSGLLPTELILDGDSIQVESIHFKNGTWEIQKGKAGYAIGTSLINMKDGNTGIFFGNTITDRINLSNVVKGSSLKVKSTTTDKNKAFVVTYEVSSISKVIDSDNTIFYPTEESRLTLAVAGEDLTDISQVIIARPISIRSDDCGL